MSHARRARLAAAALLAVAVAACADMKAMLALVGALQNEYHVPATVNRSTGGHLTIMFTEAPREKLSPDEEEEFARGVARFARSHYADTAGLTDIGVGFVTQRGVGPVTLTKSRVPYRFTIAELADSTRAPATPPPPVVAPR